MHKKIVSAGVAVSMAFVIAACVGDDPNTAGDASTTDDGGTGGGDGTVTGDGSSGSDAKAGSDSSTSGDGGVDAGFPASLPGLVLWLDADRVPGTAGANILDWPDWTSNHNDATTTLVNGPALLYHDAKFNGHSALTFSYNTALTAPDSASLRLDNTGYLIEIVESHGSLAISGSGQDPIYDKGLFANGPQIWLAAAGTSAGTSDGYGSDGVDQRFAPTSTTTVNRIRVRFQANASIDGGTLSIQAGSGSASTDVFDGPLDLSGGDAGAVLGNFGLNGDGCSIATVIVVRGAISDDDVNNLETYLNTRYGL